MKKVSSLTAIILCASLLCMSAFAAATPGSDAYAVYKRAMKKLDEAVTIQTNADCMISERNGGYDYDFEPIKISITQTQPAGKKMEMESFVHDGEYGNVLYVYYKDGYYYQRIVNNDPNEKRKTKMSEEKAIAARGGINRSLTREALKDAMLEKIDSGYRLQYKIPGKDFNDWYGNAISAIYQTQRQKIIIKSSAVTYTLDIGSDGALKSYKISYTIRLIHDEDRDNSFDLQHRLTCTVTTESEAKKINFPKNLDVYKETDL